MSVDFPAPLGPSNPMARPRSDAVRLRRMSRFPKRTVRPLSSMRGTDGAPVSGFALSLTGAPGCVIVLTAWVALNACRSRYPRETVAERRAHYAPWLAAFPDQTP